MTANIFNAYEMLTTATVTAVIVGAAVKAWDILKQRDGRAEFVAADIAWSAALAVAAENDRQRWAPAYRDVTGEVMAVESAPELRALSAESHEDEQAPADDDDHAGAWWLPVMTLPLLLARAYGYGLGSVQRGGRWLLNSLLLGVAMASSALGKLRKPKPPVYAGRHWVADVQHTGQFPTIPAQHDGEVSA